MENQHCGKHDKIFGDNKPCPGCVTERAGGFASSAQANADRDAVAVKSVATSGSSLADAIEKARSRK